ncbi:MarR family winged helix-turn-helix transcriptional regulator [Phenylobacterium sp.]|uniref:MarR family winged helix-turn-helix transcriptional regulator n=1 Tax=Phenylobacterium sp. TaxID=1871053 RepID=UPI001201AD2F|nr:MarR family winged helix-turn-helix transcriptional regulator [Phenylobacterium sp.]TAL28438.1 MAG: MarR family transcriptional regulator [Phenylobacterium sp.]
MSRLAPLEGLPPDQSLGFQVRRCHRAFDRVLNAHLAPAGLSSGFWYFLRALWQENGATQRRLAQLNNVTEPTAVAVLGAMERLDLIRRDRNRQDRRKLNVFLTPRGEALEAELIPTAARINDIAGEGVSPADLATCLSVLKRMSDNLTREAQARSPAP